MEQTYDSAGETIKHAHIVHKLARILVGKLMQSVAWHDASKLFSPEKVLFDIYTPQLENLQYGTLEYRIALEALNPALEHHYENNAHHPEHFENGIAGMTLMDIVEMFCDWKAATLRHKTGDLQVSFGINEKRFGIDPQLMQIFHNTADELNWFETKTTAPADKE